jgi:hypothetical protein
VLCFDKYDTIISLLAQNYRDNTCIGLEIAISQKKYLKE